MATDARISVGLPTHPKTKKLVKRLGQAAAWNLVCLILWAASSRSDGDLAGMSDEDIELAADWVGDEGAFVQALLQVRFLDGVDGFYMLHDWQEHNPWAAGADMRSAKARWNAAKRHHGAAEADRLVPEYAAVRNAASNATSTQPAEPQDDGGNAPSPSPSPSPSLSVSSTPLAAPKRGSRKAPAEFEPGPELLAWAHRECPVVDVHLETSKLKDHTFKASISDWDGAWRNWIRRAAENPFSGGKPAQPAETAYQRSMREKVASFAPGIAAKAPGRVIQLSDAEVFDVTPRIVG